MLSFSIHSIIPAAITLLVKKGMPAFSSFVKPVECHSPIWPSCPANSGLWSPPERLESLTTYLHLTKEQREILYNKAAEARGHRYIIVPQDFSGCIVDREYVVAALRTAQSLDAGQEDWQQFVDDLKRRKGTLEEE